MNKQYRLIADHEADLWMKAAWLRVISIHQRPRQLAAIEAAHQQLDQLINFPIPPPPNPAK